MRAKNPWSTPLLLSMMLLVASATTIGRPAAQQEAELWIHLESIGDSRVYLNLPLAAIETLVALAPDTIFEDGHPRLTRDVPVAGIRETWRELRDVGGAEFVTIPNRGPNVWRIAREGDTILVDVNVRRWFRSDWVRVEIPWRIANALLSSEGDALNVRAAVRELRARGEMIRIFRTNSNTRIWIDESRTQ